VFTTTINGDDSELRPGWVPDGRPGVVTQTPVGVGDRWLIGGWSPKLWSVCVHDDDQW
jgi:hypothetical protein